MTRARKSVGRLTFVGAGPGDPGLLAVAATQALAAAQIVYADASVPNAITDLAGGEVRLAEGQPADIAKAALAEARNGAHVVRLLAGDVFTDDGAVKEAQTAAKTVVPWDVVPGLSVGTGTAAYAGVPVGSLHTDV